MDVKGNCKLKVKPKNMHVEFCNQCTPALLIQEHKTFTFLLAVREKLFGNHFCPDFKFFGGKKPY